MRKLVIVALTALLVSCGPEETKKTVNQGTEASVGTELSLSCSDQMRFDKSMLMVKEGQEVTLTLTHTGTLPKSVMGHNWVLLRQGQDVAAFAGQAATQKEKDYIPNSEAILAHTSTIGGGEKTSVTFTAPVKGTYEYICSFPGHYSIMKGKLIVR